MFYVYVIVLYNVFHVHQATLEHQYPNKAACEIAMARLGYDEISPLGVHGECQLTPGAPPVAPPVTNVPAAPK